MSFIVDLLKLDLNKPSSYAKICFATMIISFIAIFIFCARKILRYMLSFIVIDILDCYNMDMEKAIN